ncbi:hypothetical protein [Frigidibacter oleivorans]|uniref:hypothetical protein n=1 Tax=Frigidibacter oleivorans TaxID=2487129 RepID=UPI0013E0D8E8|nr:hypothetical protein [Frigidibacter oleivorans]
MVRHFGTIVTGAAAAALALLAALPAAADDMQAFAGGSRPEVLWALPVGETDVDEDEVDAVAVDPNGNTVVSGVFRGDVRFGDRTFTSKGEGDIFVASIAPDRSINWAMQAGGPGDENTFDLRTDGQGNIILSGWFSAGVTIGDRELRNRGATDMFVVKLDRNGKPVWAKSFGGPQGDGGNEIEVLPSGEIAVALITEGDVEIDGQQFGFGGGRRDSYAIRMGADGSVKWVAPFNGPGAERIRGMGINSAGEVFVGFQFQGSVGSGNTRVESRGGWDGAVAKLTAEGRLAWIKGVGGRETDLIRGIAAGPGGSVYVAGAYVGPAFMISREVPAIGKRGDDFLLRLNGSGEPMWVASAGGGGPGTGPEIRADAKGVVISALVAGKVTVRHNKRKITELSSPTGNPTSYLAGLTPDGELRFVYMPDTLGDGSGAFGDVLGVSPDGRYLAQVLRFRGELEAGPSTMRTPSKKDSAIIFMRLNGS